MRMTPGVTFILKLASSPLVKTIATTWRREFRERERAQAHDMVIGVHEEVMYCSLSTSSGKQKKNRSTSQRQFRSENTPATIEADQILLALQQLANKNNSANFHININRISKLPKSRQRSQRLTGNLKSSSCLKTFSKRVSKSITSGQRKTELTTFILS